MGQFSTEMEWPQQTPCCLVSYLTYCPKHKVCDNGLGHGLNAMILMQIMLATALNSLASW